MRAFTGGSSERKTSKPSISLLNILADFRCQGYFDSFLDFQASLFLNAWSAPGIKNTDTIIIIMMFIRRIAENCNIYKNYTLLLLYYISYFLLPYYILLYYILLYYLFIYLYIIIFFILYIIYINLLFLLPYYILLYYILLIIIITLLYITLLLLYYIL